MTRADGILLGAVLALALLLVPATMGLASGGADSALVSGPCGETTLDLTKDGRYVVEGHLGDVVLRVEGGTVAVDESPCPEHRCMRMGPVDRTGGVIVCAPGGIVVTASDEMELDDVVR